MCPSVGSLSRFALPGLCCVDAIGRFGWYRSTDWDNRGVGMPSGRGELTPVDLPFARSRASFCVALGVSSCASFSSAVARERVVDICSGQTRFGYARTAAAPNSVRTWRY